MQGNASKAAYQWHEAYEVRRAIGQECMAPYQEANAGQAPGVDWEGCALL